MKKINLKSIQVALNRDEMRQVKGGCGSNTCIRCNTNSDCASGACINYSGADCDKTSCGCGKFC